MLAAVLLLVACGKATHAEEPAPQKPETPDVPVTPQPQEPAGQCVDAPLVVEVAADASLGTSGGFLGLGCHGDIGGFRFLGHRFFGLGGFSASHQQQHRRKHMG